MNQCPDCGGQVIGLHICPPQLQLKPPGVVVVPGDPALLRAQLDAALLQISALTKEVEFLSKHRAENIQLRLDIDAKEEQRKGAHKAWMDLNTEEQRTAAENRDLKLALDGAKIENDDLRNRHDSLKMSLHGIVQMEEQKRQEHATALRLNVSLQKELTQMGDHAARLRVCLLRWGSHFAGCPIGERTGDKCECGLEANIEAVPGEMLTSNDLKPGRKDREMILKGLWQLLRAYAGGGMPPLITNGIRLACQNAGMSEDHIASAELGGDDPDFIKQESEKRKDVVVGKGCCFHPNDKPLFCWCECHPTKGLQS